MTELPGWAQSLGGGVMFALVAWLIWRDWRRERTQEVKAQTGVDAQSDATAIALLKEMREERTAERLETREELGKVRERVAILEEDKRRHADVLQRHAIWDTKAITILQQHGDSATLTALGDPPPLYPNGG